MFKNLLKISAPKRGLKEEIWKKIQAQTGYVSAPLLRPLIFQPAFLVLILVLLGGFGTGVYAYESPAVQEGHPLQPIKRGLETVQVRLALAPEAQVRVRLQLAERRLREVEHKKRRGQFNQEALNQVSVELNLAEQLVPTIKNQAKRQAISNHLDRVRVLRVRGGQDLIKAKPQLDPGREKPQIKLKNGERLNYLNYHNNLIRASKPKIKHDQKQQNIRSEPSSLDHASSIGKSSRSIKANKISKESTAKNWSRN